VGCCYHCVLEELSVVLLELQHALEVVALVLLGLEVGVSRALLDCVPELLAAVTLRVLEDTLLVLDFVAGVFVIVVFFRLVLGKLAPWLVSAPLTAAPPHLSTELVLMGPARPVEIFLIFVFLAAEFAHLDVFVNLSFFKFHFDDSLLHLEIFVYQDFVLFFKPCNFVRFDCQFLMLAG